MDTINRAPPILRMESDIIGGNGGEGGNSTYTGDANIMLKRTLSNALANPKIVKHIRGGHSKHFCLYHRS